MYTQDVEFDAFADSRTTLASSALALTAMGFSSAQVAQARAARIVVETEGIRFRLTGDNPTASIGEPVAAGENISITGRGMLSKLRIIAQTGSPVVTITLFR